MRLATITNWAYGITVALTLASGAAMLLASSAQERERAAATERHVLDRATSTIDEDVATLSGLARQYAISASTADLTAYQREARLLGAVEARTSHIRDAGAGTRLMLDGDVAGGINAAMFGTRIDMCVGKGGTPEGIITACALKALGGLIQAKLAPKDDDERQRALDAGHDLDRILHIDDLVTSDNTYFVATGVTDGQLVDGVRRRGPVIRTESIVLRGRSGTVRRVVADHVAEKWL